MSCCMSVSVARCTFVPSALQARNASYQVLGPAKNMKQCPSAGLEALASPPPQNGSVSGASASGISPGGASTCEPPLPPEPPPEPPCADCSVSSDPGVQPATRTAATIPARRRIGRRNCKSVADFRNPTENASSHTYATYPGAGTPTSGSACHGPLC